MWKVLFISGPNLGELGRREPHIYGSASLEDHVALARKEAEGLGLSLDHFQSDSEAELIKAVNRARGVYDAIVVNAGALTHYSVALADALASFEGPKVELHITNPLAREPFRHVSVIAPVVNGVVAGFGSLGYALAVIAVARMLKEGGNGR